MMNDRVQFSNINKSAKCKSNPTEVREEEKYLFNLELKNYQRKKRYIIVNALLKIHLC